MGKENVVVIWVKGIPCVVSLRQYYNSTSGNWFWQALAGEYNLREQGFSKEIVISKMKARLSEELGDFPL
jgi:hypothetical protein